MRVKGSSIVESVLAIAIISICILMASIIYINVISQTNTIHYYNAKQQIDAIVTKIKEDKDLDNNTYNFEDYKIEKIIDFDEESQLATVDFKIKIGDKTYSEKRIIAIEN